MKKFLVIGKFCSTFGILGFIKIFSFTYKKEDIFIYNP